MKSTDKFKLISILAYIILPFQLQAQNLTIKQITDNVKLLCAAPHEPGKEFNLNTEFSADGSVRIKLIGFAGANGTISLSKSEWEGVRKVLPSEQSKENENYRECARDLAKILIDKMANGKEVLKETSISENKKPISKNAELKFPIDRTLSSKYVIFFDEFKIQQINTFRYDNKSNAVLMTPENEVVYLNENIPVDISFRNYNYKLSLKYDKDKEIHYLSLYR